MMSPPFRLCSFTEASGANGPCTPCVETLTVQSPEEWITGLVARLQCSARTTRRPVRRNGSGCGAVISPVCQV